MVHFKCRPCAKLDRDNNQDKNRRQTNQVKERECATCGNVKALTAFSKSSGFKYGVDPRCKQCSAAAQAAAYRLNPEPAKQKAKAWRAVNPYTWEEIHALRMRNAGVEVFLSPDEWQDILSLHDGKCAKCGSSEKVTVDHIISFYCGGTDHAYNVQPLCRSCNSQKGSAVLVDYRTRECRERYPFALEDISQFAVRPKPRSKAAQRLKAHDLAKRFIVEAARSPEISLNLEIMTLWFASVLDGGDFLFAAA